MPNLQILTSCLFFFLLDKAKLEQVMEFLTMSPVHSFLSLTLIYPTSPFPHSPRPWKSQVKWL